MEKKIISYGILGVMSVFTVILYMWDRLQDKERELVRVQGDVELLRSSYLDLSRNCASWITGDIVVRNFAGDTVELRSLASDGPRLGLYIAGNQCESCWKAALAYLERMMHDKEAGRKPFIVAGRYNPREYRLLRQQVEVSFPVYPVCGGEDMARIEAMGEPFYFVLQPDGSWSSVFFPDGLYEVLGDTYFTAVSQLMQSTGSRHPISRQDTDERKGLVLLNDKVNLGKVGLRKKQTAVFRIKNTGMEPCIIRDAHPLCNCLSLEKVPHVVAPGDTACFKVAFLSSRKGLVRRSVRFRIEGSSVIYMLRIEARVE